MALLRPYLFPFLFLLCLLLPGVARAEAPMAVAGAIDLSGWDAERDGPRELAGEWRLFRGRLLGPAGVADDPDDALAKVPGGWNEISQPGEPLPPRENGLGAGTYLLRLKLDPGQSRLGLMIEPPRYAYRVLWNGEVIARVGRVAADDLGDQPQRALTVVELPRATGEDELIIQISNHLHFEGGLVGRIRIGAYEELRAARYRDLYLVTLVLGGLVVMGIYHLILFMAPRGGAESGFLAYASLAVLIRLWGIPALPAEIWPETGYAFFLRLEYATSYFLPAAGLSLLRCLLPRDVPPLFEKFVWLTGILGALLSATAPGPAFTYSRLVLSSLTILTAIIAFCVTFIAIRRRRDYALIILICFTPFVAAGMAESFYFFFIGGAVPPIQAVPLGFMFCGIGFATVIGLKQRDALEAKDQFSRDLERLAATLEMKVSDRTAHLEQALREVEAARTQADEAYQSLASTQSSLVQSEKMASLGQVTAGIAHEIKNPLNFINNYAEVADELLTELKFKLTGLQLPENTQEDLSSLLGESAESLGKILAHGRRADGIVRAMLAHSRGDKGEPEPVDLNGLIDQTVTLAYHGERARNPGFQVSVERHFDPNAGIIVLQPQDISRVLLNMIDNGFYALQARQAAEGPGFKPKLEISTRDLGMAAEIIIRDNGAGMGEETRSKLFTPFFTTKPSGQGTGLGLSLSFDIVVQRHGGTIDVTSQPGEFTEFRLVLPRRPP